MRRCVSNAQRNEETEPPHLETATRRAHQTELLRNAVKVDPEAGEYFPPQQRHMWPWHNRRRLLGSAEVQDRSPQRLGSRMRGSEVMLCDHRHVDTERMLTNCLGRVVEWVAVPPWVKSCQQKGLGRAARGGEEGEEAGGPLRPLMQNKTCACPWGKPASRPCPPQSWRETSSQGDKPPTRHTSQARAQPRPISTCESSWSSPAIGEVGVSVDGWLASWLAGWLAG